MLQRLHIENFALVEKLELHFDSGMSVLTGETGAGKSIIVGALARLLGEKADKDDIRSGERLAVIEADFEIDKSSDIIRALNELDIDAESRIISLRREIPVKRASKSYINGQLVNLNQLKGVTKDLAELFGQHSHQQLLDEKNHLAFLDHFAGLNDNVEKLKEIFFNWQTAARDLKRLLSNKESAKNERELLLFQKEEIEKARIRVGEEEKLLSEKKILDSSQILGEKCSLILTMIDQSGNSALSVLGSCQKEMSDISALDKSLEKKKELLNQAAINLEEFRSEIESYLSSIPNDPDRLEEINLRLDELYRLKKKYGGSEEMILLALEKINIQLENKIDIDRQIKFLAGEELKLHNDYSKLALIISDKRKASAKKLSKTVEKELGNLGIDSADFEYEFIYEHDPTGIELNGNCVKPFAEGFENGRFLISANPGEPLKSLSKTASGGEISRIMLSLKSSERQRNKNNQARLLVFDEIDSGIGGKTANMVAERLEKLSAKYQLLVITHLHQIAAVGKNHYAVEKISSNKRNIVSVRKLTKTERKEEIDRMLALPVGE